MVQHGLAVLLVGLIGGFFLAWFVAGSVYFPPIPFTIDYQVPGSASSWRAVHTGNIMNAILALVLAMVFNWCDLTERIANRISWLVVSVIWGNAIFYIGAVFAPNHGLSLGDNAAGEGNLAGIIAFVPAIVAAYFLIGVVIFLMTKLKKAEE